MGIRTSDFSKYGLLRVAAASPRLSLAHVELNAERMLEQWHDSSAAGAALTVFPELSLTGYTCGDLFLQSVLREAALKALVSLAEESAQLRGAALVGLPLEIDQRLFNVAALVSNGQIHGFLPKRHLPNYGEFYEQRWFASARDLPRDSIRLNGVDIPVGANLIFRADTVPGLALGVEICEDLWAPKPPSTDLALGGACVLANLSASDELLG